VKKEVIMNKPNLILMASVLSVFFAGSSVALDDWQDEFNLSSRKLNDSGESKYFVLTPGFQIVLVNADGAQRNQNHQQHFDSSR
jgi:hypothetical protein